MQLPKYLLRASGPSVDNDFSESVSYDYSGADEIQKRLDEAQQQSAARYKALYDGDIGGAVAAGHRIRDLLASLGSIAPVRVRDRSVSGGSKVDTGAFEGEHDQPAPMTNLSGLAGEPRRRPGLA